MAYNIIRHRRGTTEEWQKINLVPENCELVIEECFDGSRKCKIGNGKTKFLDLPYVDDTTKTELLKKINLTEKTFDTKVSKIKSTQGALLVTVENLDEKLTKAEEALSDSISSNVEVLEEKLDKLAESTSSDLAMSIASLDEKLGKEISNKATGTTKQLKALEQNVNGLVATLEEHIHPAITELDVKIQSKAEELENLHSVEVQNLYNELATKAAELSNKINDCISTDKALRKLINDTDTKQSKDLQDAIANFEIQLTMVDDQHKNKLSELVQQIEDLIIADGTLGQELNSFKQQSSDSVNNILTQINSLNEQLSNDDVLLLNKIYEVSNILTAITASIQAELDNLEKDTNDRFTRIADEITVADQAQKASYENLLTTLLNYVTKIYAEIADLVDDDIMILNKVYAVENVLNAKINQTKNTLATEIAYVSEALNQTDSRLTDEIAKVDANLNALSDKVDTKIVQSITNIENSVAKTIEETKSELTENVESLRSTTNLTFIEKQETLDSLDKQIKDTQNSISAEISAVTSSIKTNKEELEKELYELGEVVEANTTRITETNTELELQSKRINNLIAPKPGELTRDEEVIDIRLGYNGIDHASAGDAVRAIGDDLDALKASLPSYIPSNAVDGLLYEDNQLWLTSKDIPVGDPVTITGGTGGGGSISTVRVINNLPSTSFTISKGNEALINFTYTSFENEVPTGDGVYSVVINDKKIETLSGSIQHGIAKSLNVADHLKNGSNTVKVTCTDQYGSLRTLVYTISQIELRLESAFNSTQIFNDAITFRYKVFGQIEKTAYILVDGAEVSIKKLGASVSGNEITLLIPKQAHGCHKITAHVSAVVGDNTVTSNILEYEIICIENDNNTAIITSVYDFEEATQGDLVSIPYMVYDPAKINSDIELIVYSQVAGELIEIDRTSITVDRSQQFWNTRKYPNGIAVFEISYTYNLYGVQTTITKSHTVRVAELEVDVSPEEDSMQLYLSAQGRSNNEQNPAIWEYTQAPDGDKTYNTVTTSFEGFNWTSNGWITDNAGDTCLRLNGDAKAIINFKPFAEDFKANGKTIEFEFVVRDVNDRDAVVIDCFDGSKGFRATPDTAFLKSSGTEVSCRYKDEERVRVAIAVEHSDTTSRFVSIYLDGILSGVQRYADTDSFQQNNPLTIKLGSNLCGLDIYNIRIYNKALSTSAALNNYIADQTVPTTRLQLMTDNDILDENGKVSYDRVKALGQIPIITFTGPMPTYKGDKKKKTTRMKFEDPTHPEMNFDVLLDQIDVQGTSSQFYIRKNWKVKLPEARAHMPGAIPAKVFCVKVDYAEATGTHNTGVANYVETFYDREEVILPPQKDDTRVRTTIQGFPIIIFEKETEDSEPVFSSKGNFNYDKDAENAFGFTEEYKDYGVECWEFCNNTSDTVNFAGEITADWLEDFEPRYVPESANFERIEELKEVEELAASGKGTMTSAQRNELATLMSNCIANFKEMHDWVLSTATYSLIDGKKVAITPAPLTEPIVYGETTYTEDNEEYRLAKFKYEFKNYFNMHYSSMYYVFTFFALMTDQRAKNLFLTRWKEDDGVFRWYPYFYDNDTIFGINNEGALVFDYFHEDTDQLGSSNVFNGQNSVLWNNFRLCFPKEIEDTYSELRSSGKLTYNKIIEQFVTNGSDKWSAAIYNADADYKYVSMAREHVAHKDEDGNEVTGIDASNLYQVRGPGEHHLRYFIDNRINYCDSKWYAGNYPSDDIFLRIYTPKAADDATQEEIDRINASLAVVPANPNITITPFSDMYAGVRYKSGTLQQQRLKAGESYTFKPLNENETFGDTETAIYGASEISSLGDLSGLYCGVINLSNAAKLTELTVGNPDSAYYNDNFREISVGSNRLLRYIDLRNCSGLGIAGENPQKTLELSGCPNIEHIYTEGTNLTSVDLPTSGYIKTLHLPASINTLVIKNQHYLYPQRGENGSDDFIDGFYVEGYQNIRTLCIENCPNLNTNEILANCCDNTGKYTVERVRLTGIEWGTAEMPLADASFITSLFPVFDEAGNLVSGIRGIDEKNNPLDDAYLVGTCYITKLTGEEYTEIKAHYPYLDIIYGEMTSDVIFMGADGETVLHRETIISYNSEIVDCEDPVYLGDDGQVPEGMIAKPTKDSTEEFNYEWIGWTRKLGEGVHADALLGVAGNRILYPAFEAIRRSYLITFINQTAPEGNQLLAEIYVPYGEDADYFGAGYPTPVVPSSDIYEFTGWHPAPEKIVGPMTCYAQFKVSESSWHVVDIYDIGEYYDYNEKLQVGHTLNPDGTMAIIKYNNYQNAAVTVPKNIEVAGMPYTVIRLGGFNDHDELELINLPDSLETIDSRAFQGCDTIKEITIPVNVSTINDGAFAECLKLTKINVAEGNTKFVVKQNCLIDKQSKKLLQGLTNEIPQDGSVVSLGRYCFAKMPITAIEIPNGVSSIADNAFSHCEQLQNVVLPSTLKELRDICFSWCYKLSEVVLPEGLTDIRTYVFNQCILESVIIPSTVTNIMERAFGYMSTLKSVTFKNTESGDKQPFYIHPGAFINSGSQDNPVIFNFPWTEEQHYNYYSGVDDQGREKDPTFGASNCILNFEYEEEA